MQDQMKDNPELETPDIFSAVNNYVLLFFGLSCLASSFFVRVLFYAADELRAGLLVSPVLGIILPVYIVTRRFPSGFRRQLSIARPRVLIGLYVIVATLCAVVIVDYTYTLSEKFLSTPDDYIDGLKQLKPTGTAAIATTFLAICVLVPIAEEIVFRGIIQRIFSRNMGGVLAFVLAGVFFGVTHLTPQLLLSMVVFGIFLGYLFFATRNLTYPILAHAVLNTASYIQLVVLPEDKLDSSPPYTHDVWALLLSSVFLAYLLVRIKKGASV